MTTKQTGGPAFPRAGVNLYGNIKGSQEGMTLRDYFAGQALVAFIQLAKVSNIDIEQAASVCYKFSDAMIEERDNAS